MSNQKIKEQLLVPAAVEELDPPSDSEEEEEILPPLKKQKVEIEKEKKKKKEEKANERSQLVERTKKEEVRQSKIKKMYLFVLVCKSLSTIYCY
jgi:hypothetical protein